MKVTCGLLAAIGDAAMRSPGSLTGAPSATQANDAVPPVKQGVACEPTGDARCAGNVKATDILLRYDCRPWAIWEVA
jgi:hypothetical protein